MHRILQPDVSFPAWNPHITLCLFHTQNTKYSILFWSKRSATFHVVVWALQVAVHLQRKWSIGLVFTILGFVRTVSKYFCRAMVVEFFFLCDCERQSHTPCTVSLNAAPHLRFPLLQWGPTVPHFQRTHFNACLDFWILSPVLSLVYFSNTSYKLAAASCLLICSKDQKGLYGLL